MLDEVLDLEERSLKPRAPSRAASLPSTRRCVRADFDKRRRLAAALDAVGAARREGAARRQPGQIGRLALDRVEARAPRLVEAGHRAQQAERVGMARVGVDLARGRLLDDAPAYITFTRSA